MLEAYRQHVAERSALGIPPLPLTKQQVTELVELLNRPTKLMMMANEAIAFARDWGAANQGARLAALYRQLLRAPCAIDCSRPMPASQ